MIDPTVRRAHSDDEVQLRYLEAEARQALAEQRGGVRWLGENPPHDWSGPLGGVLVAHISDVLVGFLVFRVEIELAIVDNVYVTPEARELGFGDALLEMAIDDARSLGATALDAQALPGDRQTKNLYERAGIKARLIVVSTPL